MIQSGSRGDEYVGMEIGLPRDSDGTLEYATIKKRSLDSEGEPIGKLSKYKILDSREYEVEFVNGDTEHFTVNTIVEIYWHKLILRGNGNCYWTRLSIIGSSKLLSP